MTRLVFILIFLAPIVACSAGAWLVLIGASLAFRGEEYGWELAGLGGLLFAVVLALGPRRR